MSPVSNTLTCLWWIAFYVFVCVWCQYSWLGQSWQPALSICSIKKRKRTLVHCDLAQEQLCGLINWRDKVGVYCGNLVCDCMFVLVWLSALRYMWNVWAANVLKWTFVFLHVLLPSVKHQLPGFSWILLIAALHVVKHIKRMAWLSSVHVSTTVKCAFTLYTNVLLCFRNVRCNVNICNVCRLYHWGFSLYM